MKKAERSVYNANKKKIESLYNQLEKAETSSEEASNINNTIEALECLSESNLEMLQQFATMYHFKPLVMNGGTEYSIENYNNNVVDEVGLGLWKQYELWIHDYCVSVCCPYAVSESQQKKAVEVIKASDYMTKTVYVFNTVDEALVFTANVIQQSAVKKELDEEIQKAVADIKAKADAERKKQKEEKQKQKEA